MPPSQTTIKAYYWVPEIIDMETPSQSQRGHGNTPFYLTSESTIPFPKEKRSSQMLTPQMKAFHRVRLRYPSGGQHFHQVQKQVHQIYSRSHQVVIYRAQKKQERLSNQMPYVLPSTQDGVMQDCHP